ncbi:wax ester/triacylglycerol synthase family O-acyltransferase [Nocardia higoensis]|uniref:Diacylglycerol O-acyltransferase n=1 Tax=Nocardia higoensis TaxID=228599 RepID=A0ABS0D3B0_9NOCA|nr:wax ester/triacylglycerol synthase family O-acyltransferase [Nocardia higoensis]MBF6352981.1 wax ester/triacylglycerol synthase family O-acyltransferase [Nocardia higoensis]
MTKLTALDAGFMEMEDTDRRVGLGIGVVAIVGGAPPTREEFRVAVDRGLERHRRLRQRVRRAPFDVTAPEWEEDPNFDLAHHIRWTALAEPGDETGLRELVASELSERLDRDHPLWKVVVVEHLADDCWAMIVKAHHSMIDGISGVTLFESFCDPETEPGVVRAGVAGRGHTGLFELAGRAVRLPYTMPRLAVGTVRALAPVLLAAVAPAAESSLNGPIGQQRRYVVARASLPEVREIGAAFGVTVNDVAVAAIAAAYRRLLLGRGEQPTPGKMRIAVPVSMRTTTEAKDVLDNRVAAMIAELPIDIDEPVERLIAVHERIARHRSRGEPEAEKSLLSLATRVPSALRKTVFRIAAWFPQRGVSALATNIPGPKHRLTLGGREVLEIWPCIPIAMRVRTTVAILSYVDQLTFGITGDYDTTPDIEVLASGVATEIAVLLAHARGQPAQRRLQLIRGRNGGSRPPRPRSAR